MTNKKLNWALLPTVVTLAWPTMLEQLLQTSVQYIDTAMVGALGTAATAAVGATGTLNWLVSGTIAALGVGFLAYIARANGAQDQKSVAKAAAQTVLAVLVCGVVFTFLTVGLSGVIPAWMQVEPEIRPLASRYFYILYLPMLPRTASILFGTALRAVGDTKTPMRVSLGMNILNVLLNFLLIFPTRQIRLLGQLCTIPGAGLGVEGAAIASAVSFVAGGIWMTVAFWRHPVLRPGSEKIRPDWTVLKPCLKVACPNMLQRFGTSLGYVVFATMINALGETATAAHTIANTVESAFYIPGYGMQSAAATLAGNAYGARDKQKLTDLPRLLLVLETGLMILSGGLLFALAPNMVGLFSKEPAVIALGATVLRMVALSEPFFGIGVILQGLLQGVGDTKTPFVYDICSMWGVRIVGTFVCTVFLHLGLVSAWTCMIGHNLVLFGLLLRHYRKGRWNPLNA